MHNPFYFPQNVYFIILSSSVQIIHLFISIQPLGWFGRNQSSVRWPVWLWHAASWANFL